MAPRRFAAPIAPGGGWEGKEMWLPVTPPKPAALWAVEQPALHALQGSVFLARLYGKYPFLSTLLSLIPSFSLGWRNKTPPVPAGCSSLQQQPHTEPSPMLCAQPDSCSHCLRNNAPKTPHPINTHDHGRCISLITSPTLFIRNYLLNRDLTFLLAGSR